MIPQTLHGSVSSEIRQLTKSCLKKENISLVSHDEALQEVNKWFGFFNGKSNIAINSKYPYVFKSIKEIIEPLDEYKVLILPSPIHFERQTVGKFIQIINKDKNAEIVEINKLLKQPIAFEKKKKKNIKQINEFEINLNICDVLLKKIQNDMKISEKEIKINKFKYYSTVQKKQKFIPPKTILLESNENFKKIPDPSIYLSTFEWIQCSIDSNVQFQSNFKTIPMKGKVKLKDIIQGKNSAIRNQINRKVKAFRGQIALHPRLPPNAVIFPYTRQADLGVYAKKMVDLTDPFCNIKECLVPLKQNLRIAQKRDPAINADAFCFYDTVAFALTNYIFIGPGGIQNKNADFDGDTESAIIFSDPIEIHEIDINVLPQNKLKNFSQTRIAFTESHILAMHQRLLPVKSKFKELYSAVSEMLTEDWMLNPANRISLNKLYLNYPHIDWKIYIEPTREILEKVLSFVIQLYGSNEGYNFFNFINEGLLDLANGIQNDFYCSYLPNEYFMEDDILCEAIIKICFSGAKGSIDTLFNMAEKIFSNDGTTKITEKIKPLDCSNLFENLSILNQALANNSKDISVHGHHFFLSNIGYETFSFDKNALCCNNIVIYENLQDLIPYKLYMDEIICQCIHFNVV